LPVSAELLEFLPSGPNER